MNIGVENKYELLLNYAGVILYSHRCKQLLLNTDKR